MALRTPAGNYRRSPVWRRSGDESHWDSLISEKESSQSAAHPARPPRPQSAIEGRHLDKWLEHLQTMQSKIKAPVDNKALYLNDQTKSVSVLHKDPPGRVWRPKCFPSISRGSSLYDSSSFCESSFSSQDSQSTGFRSPPRQRGSWAQVHFLQTPRKEKAQLSDLAPVKTGWLPVHKEVIGAEAMKKKQYLDQVKLKQPITPMFQSSQGASRPQELEKSPSSPSSSGGKTWQTREQGSLPVKQVTEKHHSAGEDKGRIVSWQALKRGWNASRLFGLPGGKKPDELPTGTNAGSTTSPPQLKDATSTAPLKECRPHHTDSVASIGSSTAPPGAHTTGTCKTHNPLQRTRVVQPLKATLPLSGMDSCTRSSHIQTSSAVATLIPQNKTGFSSITISSRKVTRSSSLPGSGNSSRSPSPTLNNQEMDQYSRQVTTHRKATIVKVTERRVSSAGADKSKTGMSPALDTVVHRRKATIIKVTEHRESYSPAWGGPMKPEKRHSYPEGLHCSIPVRRLENQSRSKIEPSNHPVNSPPHAGVAPSTVPSRPGTNGTLHRSTLSLFVHSPASLTASASSDLSPNKDDGRTSDRPRRPLSCYGSLVGHTQPNVENVTQQAPRKLSYGPPPETNITPVNPDRSLISHGKLVKREGEPVADILKLNGRKEKTPPSAEDATRRASPCLTLIKAPDPDSNRSPEEVLALNAAAIIANIKLQRQRSKKEKTANGELKDHSTVTKQRNTEEVKGLSPPFNQDQRCIDAGFIPLCQEDDLLPEVSLQQALKKFRPEFISRSQDRVRELERRAQERRDMSQTDAALRQRNPHGNQSVSPKDNLFRPRDRVITRKEVQLRPKQTSVEVRRKKDEDKRREICLSNRQRVDLFKKRLLDQLLHRSVDSQ